MAGSVPILLVEDDEVDAEAVRRAVKRTGIGNPLYAVSDGIDALHMLQGGTIKQPCIILLDINMPRMNGFQFLGEMRKDEVMRRNIVFMLTTSARSEDVRTAYSHQAAGYFLKESLDDFIPLLHGYCRSNTFPDW